ncbi:MAG: NADH-quinone oxidoreductase subunit I [Myxococcales bacterium]|nr:NADH-quinone oxidoreductase subunit I [Myxococcales bacterium]
MASGHHAAPPSDGPVVVSTSVKNPKQRSVLVARPTNDDASFLSATLTGLGITFKHFARNLLLPRDKGDIETVQYPEETIPYPERFRGLHRLMLRDDGNVRCVACMCCPTACPANCITIVPEEAADGSIEKRPAIFEIDELRCIACGLCVEACPCDAIRMDTGVHVKPVYERNQAIMNKEELMSRGSTSIATQGGEGAEWREKP